MNNKINVEQLFLSSLGSTDKLKWYLTENINVLNYIPLIWLNLTIAVIPKSKRIEMLKDFNVDMVIGILKMERQDLYKVLISHHNGRLWLGEQILNFRKHFLK